MGKTIAAVMRLFPSRELAAYGIQVCRRLADQGFAVHILAAGDRADLDTMGAGDMHVHVFAPRAFHSQRYARLSARMRGRHSASDEQAWLRAAPGYAPELAVYLQAHGRDFDWFLCFGYDQAVLTESLDHIAGRTLLVPCAPADGRAKLPVFAGAFARCRAIAYTSMEEQSMIEQQHGAHPLSTVTGMGMDIAEGDAQAFRQTYGIQRPFILCASRLDTKELQRLARYVRAYNHTIGSELSLVLLNQAEPLPDTEDVISLSEIDEQMQLHALAAADCLVDPRRYACLGGGILRAWGSKRAVLVNGRCGMLKGRVIRGSGGLFYTTLREFIYCLHYLLRNKRERRNMGSNGRLYTWKQHNWQKITRDYLYLLGDN